MKNQLHIVLERIQYKYKYDFTREKNGHRYVNYSNENHETILHYQIEHLQIINHESNLK